MANAQEQEEQQLIDVVVISSVYKQFPFWVERTSTYVVDAWINTDKDDLTNTDKMRKLRFNFTDKNQADNFWNDTQGHPFLISVPAEVLESTIE